MPGIDVLIEAGWTPGQILVAGIAVAIALAMLGLACAVKTSEEQVQASEDRALSDQPIYPLGDDTMAMLHGVSIEEYQRMCADAAIRQAGSLPYPAGDQAVLHP